MTNKQLAFEIVDHLMNVEVEIDPYDLRLLDEGDARNIAKNVLERLIENHPCITIEDLVEIKNHL